MPLFYFTFLDNLFRRVPASRVDLTGMTKLEEYLSQACAAEDIYQTSRRCSTRELFSSLER